MSLVLWVMIESALPAIDSSIRRLSDSSGRFGRQRKLTLTHSQVLKTASRSSARSSEEIDAAANKSTLARKASYSRYSALPSNGLAPPVKHRRNTSRAAPLGDRIAQTNTLVSITTLPNRLPDSLLHASQETAGKGEIFGYLVAGGAPQAVEVTVGKRRWVGWWQLSWPGSLRGGHRGHGASTMRRCARNAGAAPSRTARSG